MTDRPKPGARFLHRHFLDNEAFEQGRRDVHATHVVTATRKWGPGPDDITVYHTPASVYDVGRRKGSWYFDLGKADDSVKEWLSEAGQ
jgi:hypothetical protein